MQVRKETIYILIAGAVLLLGGAVYRYFPNIMDGWSLDEEIALEKEKQKKYIELGRERSSLEARLIKMNRSLERAEAGLLSGETPAMAGVDVQNALASIASRSSVEIESIYVLARKETDESVPFAGEYPEVQVEVGLVATIRQLKEMLHGIESSSTLLRISEARCDTEGAKKMGLIKIRLTIEGFMNNINRDPDKRR